MITGAIAVVFIIAMIACAGNGEWGPFAVGAVIVVLLLAIGSASRKENRAYNNWVNFWANGKTPGERNAKSEPRLSRRERKEQERIKENVRKEQREFYELESQNGTKKTWERLTCPKCKTNAVMERTVIRANGAEIWQIKCPECRETTTMRVK